MIARADGTRSSLIFETLKIIESMGTWKPRVVIGKNVKNVLSKRMKLAFDRYLSDMERLDYTNNFDVLNARGFGIPQARERVFVVSRLCGSVFNFARLKKSQCKIFGVSSKTKRTIGTLSLSQTCLTK
ncbi:DNA cytosine methyltransferase [Sporosarcina newyorkensis]|uniref:DNA cytosine methyltransferase n=1 Tax=Sporosarcina newyorkensis TaxID=759851 RepID=UPI0009990FAD